MLKIIQLELSIHRLVSFIHPSCFNENKNVSYEHDPLQDVASFNNRTE